MTYRRLGRGRRPAFTLIELLVVIAIIAILVGLTTAAVMRFMTKGPELQTKADMQNLDADLNTVVKLPGHEVTYLPSKMVLRKQNGYNMANAVEADTVRYLTARFGRHACFDFGTPPAGQFLDWNGDGVANEVLTLEGEQCLVFHLGGVPVTSGGLIRMVGFSENESNPALAPQAQGERRQGPYFEFQTARLKPYPAPTAAATFPVYMDPWNAKPTPQPFLFFASYSPTGGGLYSDASHKYGSSDCASFGVSPYYQAGTGGVVNYMNPTSWQIISAGNDGKFGPGGQWNPAAGLGNVGPGADDQANFSPRKLGAAAQ